MSADGTGGTSLENLTFLVDKKVISDSGPFPLEMPIMNVFHRMPAQYAGMVNDDVFRLRSFLQGGGKNQIAFFHG